MPFSCVEKKSSVPQVSACKVAGGFLRAHLMRPRLLLLPGKTVKIVIGAPRAGHLSARRRPAGGAAQRRRHRQRNCRASAASPSTTFHAAALSLHRLLKQNTAASNCIRIH